MNLKGVNQFFALFSEGPAEGASTRSFRTPEDLVSRFQGDLKELVSLATEKLRRAAATVPKPPPTLSDPDLGDVLKTYLRWVVETHERLELRGIGGTAALASIPLEDVYVALRGIRASDNERQQSRKLFQEELLALVRALPQAITGEEFARLLDEAEARAG